MGSKDTSGNTAALNNANNAYTQYTNDYGQWQNQYNEQRRLADQAWGQDFGNSASDFMRSSNQAGIQAANQQLDQGARAATNQAQLASRQAGLTKGQAAMNAAGAANQMYQNNWNNAVQQGAQNYGNAAQMNQQQKQGAADNSMNLMGQAQQGQANAMGTQAAVGSRQVSDFDRNMGIISGAGQAALGIASAFYGSDERGKKEIEPANDWYGGIMKKLDAMYGSYSDVRAKETTPGTDDMIADVAERINNYTYRYKPGMGEDTSVEYSGPMAQELLQVDGYRSCVFEGPDGLLKVDTGRLALVNAGMVSDLSKRLLFLEEFIKSVMAGLQEQPMPDVQ